MGGDGCWGKMQVQGRKKYSERWEARNVEGEAVPTLVYFRTRYSSSCILARCVGNVGAGEQTL